EVGPPAERRIGGTTPDRTLVLGKPAAHRRVDGIDQPALAAMLREESLAAGGLHGGLRTRLLGGHALVDLAALLGAEQVRIAEVTRAGLGQPFPAGRDRLCLPPSRTR